VHIPQEAAAVIKRGDSATLTAPGDVKITGKVTVVSPALDPNSTTVEVWVEAANPKGILRPGTTVNVQMAARAVNDAIVIPAEALLKTPEGESVVMVAGKDGLAHQVNVEIGVREDDQVQITKGLNGGESVIVRGAYGIPDKTKVTTTAWTPPKEGAKGEAADKSDDKKDDKSDEKKTDDKAGDKAKD
jgi:HlyD family secretion protein